MQLNSIEPISETTSDLRVCLDFTGGLATGGYLTLTIARDGRTEERVALSLPPLAELSGEMQQHWKTYRQLARDRAQRSRLKLVEVFYEKTDAELLEECQASAERLLTSFRQWLSRAEMQRVSERIRTHLSPSQRARLSIVATDRDVERLPWQSWPLLDDYPRLEPTFSFPDLSQCPPPIAIDRDRRSARILAIFGNDDDIETGVDLDLLERTANEAEDGSIELHFAIAPRRAQLEDALHEGDWDILFFAGHSRTEADTGRIFINDTESVTIDELWYSLSKAVDRGLRLAIFNSCDGLGIARGLNTARIPQMAIVREAVPDRVAQDFLRYFLEAFAREQLPLPESIRYARQRLARLEAEHPCATWLPVLYQHPEADVLTWEKLVSPSARGVSPEPEASPEPKQRPERAQQPDPEFEGLRAEIGVCERPHRGLLGGVAAMAMLPLLWLGVAAAAERIGRQAFYGSNHVLAANAFEVQVRLSPFAGMPRYNLAQIYDRKHGDPDRAIELMRGAALRGSALAYPEWARLLLDRGEFERAEFAIAEGFAMLSEEQPNYEEAIASLHSQAAWLALLTDRLDDADRHASKSIALFPDSSGKAWCVHARVQMARGEDAREAWRKAIAQADRHFVNQVACKAAGEMYLNGFANAETERDESPFTP